MTELRAVQENEEPSEQMEFHGFPVAEQKYVLLKPEGFTDRDLKNHEFVKGVFEGHIKGFKYDGDLKRWVWAIEVTFVELT